MSFCKPVAASVTSRELSSLFRVLEGHCSPSYMLESQLAQDMSLHISEEMPAGQPESLECFEDIKPLGKRKVARVH